MQQYDAWRWHFKDAMICPNASSINLVEVHMNQGFICKPQIKYITCHYYVFTYTASISWFFMHETGINGFLAFFWWFFIYKLFHSELRLNYYDFLKFRQYSGISWVKIILEINYCVSSMSAWCKRVNGADQVKPDQWVPVVSDPVN